MSTSAWIALSIAAVVFMLLEFLKSKRGGGRPRFAPPVGYHAPFRLFLGWAFVLVTFNSFGFLVLLGMKFVAERNASAFWMLGMIVAWLFFTAYFVMPVALPADYRRRQETGKVNVGTGLLAACFFGWMIAQFASVFTWVTTVS